MPSIHLSFIQIQPAWIFHLTKHARQYSNLRACFYDNVFGLSVKIAFDLTQFCHFQATFKYFQLDTNKYWHYTSNKNPCTIVQGFLFRS